MATSRISPLPAGSAETGVGGSAAWLQALLRREIERAGGAIPFERFMELALYAPGHGYYVAGQPRFGAAGDFVTAPEVSPLFPRCVARALAPGLRAVEEPVVLELGAGTGRLAEVLIPALSSLGVDLRRYLILEPSPALRAEQRQRLRRMPVAVEWLDTWPAEPITGAVLANEVLDAMPVARFRKRSAGGCAELMVRVADDGFAWAERIPPRTGLAEAVAAIEAALGEPLPAGYESEVNLLLAPWVRGLADAVARGEVLLIDYGYTRREYYHPQRGGGTLLGQQRHRVSDSPLQRPGEQDLSSFVDFTAVAEAAVAAGFAVAGYTTQAHFLIEAGIDAVLAELGGGGGDAGLAMQARRLLMPGMMGEAFKVMRLTRGGARVPAGRFDQRARL